MTFKYRATLVGVIALAALAVLGYFRPASQQGIVVAKATDLGVEVPDTNGKVTQFQNGVYKIEPENFAVEVLRTWDVPCQHRDKVDPFDLHCEWILI